MSTKYPDAYECRYKCGITEAYSVRELRDIYRRCQTEEWKESCDACHWYLTNKCPYEKGESFVMVVGEMPVCPLLQKAIDLIVKSIGRTHKKVQLYIEDDKNSLYCELECDETRGDEE